jgi:hypothetical protein
MHRLYVVMTVALIANLACSKLYRYPDIESENTDERCKDGIDNDLNGKTDCADPSCDGRCPEQSLEACTDGRDNDGDGLIDFADPRCWPFANLSIGRCASVRATTFTSSFDPASAAVDWYTGDGSPLKIETSTTGPSVLDVYLAQVGSNALFFGSWTGLSLEFDYDKLDGVQVELVSEAIAPARAPTRDMGTLIFSDEMGASLLVNGGLFQGNTVTDRSTDEFCHASITVDREMVRAETRCSGGTFVISAPRALLKSETTPLFRVVFDGGRIAHLSLRLPGYDPCAVAVPQIPGTDLSGQPNVAANAVAVDDRGDDCAITSVCGVVDRMASFASPDGDHWSLASTMFHTQDAEVAGIAWDGAASVYRAVIADAMGNFFVEHSADCATWEGFTKAFGPVDRGMFPLDICYGGRNEVSYVIRTIGGNVRHEIYYTVRPNPAQFSEVELWRASSTDGTSFRQEGEPIVRFGGEDGIENPLFVRGIGPRDLVLTHQLSSVVGRDGIVLRVAEDDEGATWMQAGPTPLIGPTDVPGTFDRLAIFSAALFQRNGGWSMLYSAHGDYDADVALSKSPLSVGTAILTIAPP